VGAVLDPPDCEFDSIEHLAGMLVQDGCRACDGLLVLAQHLGSVPGCRSDKHEGGDEQRSDQQQAVETDGGHGYQEFRNRFGVRARVEKLCHNSESLRPPT
jgi:hypothetical protein